MKKLPSIHPIVDNFNGFDIIHFMEFLNSAPLAELEQVSNVRLSVREDRGLSEVISPENFSILVGVAGLIGGMQLPDFNNGLTLAGAIAFAVGIALSLKMPNLDLQNVPSENPYPHSL